MYASKRRQRNFKRVRETTKSNTNAPSNPSKRHRERLNGELETVAGLLPYEESVLQRLDKLSVLRLAVSYLHIKAHFQACAHSFLVHGGNCPRHPFAYVGPVPRSVVPSLVDTTSGVPLIDIHEPFFSNLAQKENIETYLGFLQSDVLHQPLFEMIHSEDRDELKQTLRFDPNNASPSEEEFDSTNVRTVVARFRCLLDNTCGFIRVEIKGRFMSLHSSTLPQSSSYVPPNQQPKSPSYVLVATCTPFVPPIQFDPNVDDPILKTKHALDLSLSSMDNRVRAILELDENDGENGSSKGQSFYSLVHPEDVSCVTEAHDSVIKYSSSGLMIYRLIGKRSGTIHFVQSSLRLFFKNGKPEAIGGNHRLLTEVDGHALLEKRASLKFKYISFDDTLLQSPRIFQGAQSSVNCSDTSGIQITVDDGSHSLVPCSSIQTAQPSGVESKDRKQTSNTTTKSQKSKNKSSKKSTDIETSKSGKSSSKSECPSNSSHVDVGPGIATHPPLLPTTHLGTDLPSSFYPFGDPLLTSASSFLGFPPTTHDSLIDPSTSNFWPSYTTQPAAMKNFKRATQSAFQKYYSDTLDYGFNNQAGYSTYATFNDAHQSGALENNNKFPWPFVNSTVASSWPSYPYFHTNSAGYPSSVDFGQSHYLAAYNSNLPISGQQPDEMQANVAKMYPLYQNAQWGPHAKPEGAHLGGDYSAGTSDHQHLNGLHLAANPSCSTMLSDVGALTHGEVLHASASTASLPSKFVPKDTNDTIEIAAYPNQTAHHSYWRPIQAPIPNQPADSSTSLVVRPYPDSENQPALARLSPTFISSAVASATGFIFSEVANTLFGQ
ncbi:PAS fold domain-containing protein [Ditylenchus destructor]|uniref:PAS fold domain-containing protein n=1 Tax=Ditylenchus destructor TaxID=166010 RepID=A0AAD4RAZ5_9BILA|nr:PAS fold domain-containing protein [Ditylenchus destructor]